MGENGGGDEPNYCKHIWKSQNETLGTSIKFDVRSSLQWPRFMCTKTVIPYITFIIKGKICVK
jgi:hypothetical protein